ncbi:MAG: DUF4493 domain-containing protein [Rikenellaceae bacterium]
MKKLITYIYLLLAIVMVGCDNETLLSDQETITNSSTEGVVSISFGMGDSDSAATKAGDDDSDSNDEILAELLAKSIMKVYNSEGSLIRRYEPATECPETLQLVSDSYTVAVSIGSSESPVYEEADLYYYGKSDFTITAGSTASVTVNCNLVNSLIKVDFEDSVVANFEEGYRVTVAAVESITADMVEDTYRDKLQFVDEGGEGYIILPEGVSTIAWKFEGTKINSMGDLSLSGVISGAKSAEEYDLTFAYDKYLDLASMKLTVDDTTEDYDDDFNFSPQPTIKASGFSSSVAVDLADDTSLDFTVTSLSNLSKMYISCGSETLMTMNLGDETGGVDGTYSDADSGVSFKATSATSGTLTVGRALFNKVSTIGEYDIKIVVYDTGNTYGSLTITIHPTGIVGLSNENMWLGSIDAAAVVGDPGSGVAFEVSTDGTTWESYEATSTDGYNYTATLLGTEWTATTNDVGTTCYTPSGGLANDQVYQYRLVVDGTVHSTSSFTSSDGSQSIPNGDLNDTSLACFKTSNGSSTWDSGNFNELFKDYYLCNSATVNGAVCAKLETITAFTKTAAGNIFYGDFNYSNYTGTVSFGRSFTWNARPKSLKLKYAASLATGSITAPSGTADAGTSYSKDRARIFLAIVDWSSQHAVSAGASGDPTGAWDPATQTSVTEGNIIGYASCYIDESTASTSQLYDLELPIHYYDKVTKPSKSYTIVISCAASAYGDYKIGNEGSVLYVDDFELGY